MTEWGRQWRKLVDLMRDEAIEIQNVGGEGYYLVSPTKLADRLLNNGVTVQEWIPFAKQKPGENEQVLVFFEGMRGTSAETQIIHGWAINGSATHWMPKPKPPKEDNHATDGI